LKVRQIQFSRNFCIFEGIFVKKVKKINFKKFYLNFYILQIKKNNYKQIKK